MVRRWRILAIVAASAFLMILPASAQSDGLVLTRFTVDGGGGTSSDGSRYTLSGTIGQADGGWMAGEPYGLTGGFWVAAAGTGAPGAMVYLPLVQR